MTAHEVFSSLLWIVLLGYVAYLGWFIVTTVSGWGSTDQVDLIGPGTHANPDEPLDADLFEWPPPVSDDERRRAS